MNRLGFIRSFAVIGLFCFVALSSGTSVAGGGIEVGTVGSFSHSSTTDISSKNDSPFSTRPDVTWMRSGIDEPNARMAYSPDGQYLATSEFAEIKLWQVSDHILTRTYSAGDCSAIGQIKFAPDGQHVLYVCNDSINTTSSLRRLNVSTGSTDLTYYAYSISGLDPTQSQIGVMPNGDVAFAPVGVQGQIRFFDYTSGSQIGTPLTQIYYTISGQTYFFPICGVGNFSESGLIGVLTQCGPNPLTFLITRNGAALKYYYGDALFLSPDGTRVTTLSPSKVFSVAQLCSPDAVPACDPSNPGTPIFTPPIGIFNAIISPDNQFLAGISSVNTNIEELEVYNMATGSHLYSSQPVYYPAYYVFSPNSQNVTGTILNGNGLCLTLSNYSIPADQATRYESFYYDVQDVRFSPNSQQVATFSNRNPENLDANVRIFDSANGALLHTLSAGDQACGTGVNGCLKYSADGNYIFTETANGNVEVWRTSDYQLDHTLNGVGGYGFVISPDGSKIAGDTGIFDTQNGTFLHTGPGGLMRFRDNNTILSYGYGGSICRQYDVTTGNPIGSPINSSIPGYFYNSMDMSSDGSKVALSGAGVTEIWDIDSATLYRQLSYSGQGWGTRFSPDGNYLFISTDGGTYVYELDDGTLAAFYDEELPGIGVVGGLRHARSLDISPDGSKFAYGRYDATLVVANNPFSGAGPTPTPPATFTATATATSTPSDTATPTSTATSTATATDTPTPAPNCYPAPTGMVAWYKGEYTANDHLGLNPGTLHGSVAFSSGEVGQAFSLDGGTAGIAVPDSPSLAITSSLTIDAWVNITSLPPPGVDRILVFRGDNRNGKDPYALTLTNDGMVKFRILTIDDLQATVFTPIPTGQWVHLAATLDDPADVMKIYINGVQAAIEACGITPFADLDPLQSPGIGIGNLQGGSNFSQGFNGLMDEVEIYNRALSASEIANIFSAGANGKCPLPAVSGTITYGNASVPPKYISNVTVSGTGSQNISSFSAPPGTIPGQYSLSGFGAGSYTVSLAKTTGQNSITSNDAARIASHVSGTNLLTTSNQKVSADVTGNGAISSQDAAKIAQIVAGLPFSPPNFTGQWRFFVSPGPTFPIGSSPTSRTYSSITSNITGDDYVGLLIGEVTGNWTPSAARPVGGRQLAVGSGPETDVAVELPQLTTPVDKEVVVPVSVKGVANKDVISYEFNLRYDPSVIQPVGDGVDLKETVSRGLSVVTNATVPGILRVVVYGALPIDENGVLLNLRFTAVGAAGSVSSISFERVMFNEGLPVTVSDGELRIEN